MTQVIRKLATMPKCGALGYRALKTPPIGESTRAGSPSTPLASISHPGSKKNACQPHARCGSLEKVFQMVYLDNASTTYPKPECVYAETMEQFRRLGVSPSRGCYSAARDMNKIVYSTRFRHLDTFPLGTCCGEGYAFFTRISAKRSECFRPTAVVNH